ncbi:MAG: type 4a pilus biogenesis protein PilO [Candidatus Eisenbacteria bacterium]|nr:type 4a pilus biogenesis protein PilO [Candidatus Eisenbacteria bacterium]
MKRIDLKDPNTQRSVLSFLGVGLLAYLFFFAPFVPGNYQARAKRLGELKSKYSALSSDLTKARQAVASLDRLEDESRKLHERWATVREQLPDQRELASLLRKITLAGSQAGVRFHLFKPEPPVASQFYTDNPVRVTVVGGYHQVATFLSEVAGLGRLVNSHDLTMTTYTQDSPDFTTQAMFVASAYTLGGSGPSSASKGAKATTAKGAKRDAHQTASVTP